MNRITCHALILLMMATATATAGSADYHRHDDGTGSCDDPQPYALTSRMLRANAAVGATDVDVEAGAACYAAADSSGPYWMEYDDIWINFQTTDGLLGYNSGQVSWAAWRLHTPSEQMQGCQTQVAMTSFNTPVDATLDPGCPAGGPPRTAPLLP